MKTLPANLIGHAVTLPLAFLSLTASDVRPPSAGVFTEYAVVRTMPAKGTRRPAPTDPTNEFAVKPAITTAFKAAPKLSPKHPRAIQLEAAMQEYSSLSDGWAGDGSVAPNVKALRDMRAVAELTPRGLPIPTASISFDGEIGLYWDEPTYFLDIAFDGSGSLSVFAKQKGSGADQFLDSLDIASGAWKEALQQLVAKATT